MDDEEVIDFPHNRSKSLRNAQKYWLKYRDGQCYSITARETGASLRAVFYNICKTSMAIERIQELQRLTGCTTDLISKDCEY